MIRKLCWFELAEYDTFRVSTREKVPKYYRVFWRKKGHCNVWIAVWGIHFILHFIITGSFYFHDVYCAYLHNWRTLMFVRTHKRRISLMALLEIMYITLGKGLVVPHEDLLDEYFE